MKCNETTSVERWKEEKDHDIGKIIHKCKVAMKNIRYFPYGSGLQIVLPLLHHEHFCECCYNESLRLTIMSSWNTGSRTTTEVKQHRAGSLHSCKFGCVGSVMDNVLELKIGEFGSLYSLTSKFLSYEFTYSILHNLWFNLLTHRWGRIE